MAPPTTIEERRRPGAVNALRRAGNTALLFFLNPVLDPDTNRLSGTRLMAVAMVWMDCYDIRHSHSIQELMKNKGTVDALDWHNNALFLLAALVWFGKPGMELLVDLVKAWKGDK